MNSPRLVDGDKLQEWAKNHINGKAQLIMTLSGSERSYAEGVRDAFITMEDKLESLQPIPSDQGEATRLNYDDLYKLDLLASDENARKLDLRNAVNKMTHEYRQISGEVTRLREAMKETMKKEWELAGEPTPVYVILHQALSSKGDTERLSFSGKHDFKPGINTEG